MQVESKVGKIEKKAEEIFKIISDFRKIEPLVPKEQIKDFIATEDNCTFTVENYGTLQLKIANKEPFKLVKYTGGENSPLNFFLWIQLKEIAVTDTRIKITLRTDVPKIAEIMVKKKVEKALNNLIEKISSL